ncbi:hypothetical protein G6F45_014333 [Rhizopus arrhizus]|nr:hypothetical protein G6F45_014333 [Rhizopus arrhizus]
MKNGESGARENAERRGAAAGPGGRREGSQQLEGEPARRDGAGEGQAPESAERGAWTGQAGRCNGSAPG